MTRCYTNWQTELPTFNEPAQRQVYLRRLLWRSSRFVLIWFYNMWDCDFHLFILIPVFLCFFIAWPSWCFDAGQWLHWPGYIHSLKFQQVQWHCFTSTESKKPWGLLLYSILLLLGTGSPGLPPRLSHSSWALTFNKLAQRHLSSTSSAVVTARLVLILSYHLWPILITSSVKYDTRGNKSIAYIYINGNLSISGLSNFYIF